MPKHDDIIYFNEHVGKAKSLEIHLTSNFYPPLPATVKKIFLDAFNLYWAHAITITQLEKELSRVYRGGLDDYGFYHYLNEDDLEEAY
jgi:hypothetical protein